MMATSEKPLQTEEQIPALAEEATRLAYARALSAGHSVLVVKDGFLVEIFPDGTVDSIRSITPATPVVPGQIVQVP
jgi:hypothetical protein